MAVQHGSIIFNYLFYSPCKNPAVYLVMPMAAPHFMRCSSRTGSPSSFFSEVATRASQHWRPPNLTGRITTLDKLGLPRYSGIQIATRKDQKSSKVKIYGSQMFIVLICDTQNDHLLASISLVGPECMGSPLYHSVGSHQIFNVHDPCHLAKTTWSCSGFQEPEKALRTFGNDGNHGDLKQPLDLNWKKNTNEFSKTWNWSRF